MSKNRILIVDDNESNRYLLRAILTGNGYDVTAAGNGAEALEKARLEPPHLIIADILMPLMDGFALCREWKKDPVLKSIPFVFYTATYTDDRDRDFALSLGAERFVIKPAEPEELLAILHDTLEQYQSTLPTQLAPATITPITRLKSEEESEALQLKHYNEALIRKLEDKMEQLEWSNRELQQRILTQLQVERALRESEERYRQLHESMTDCFAQTTMSGEIVDANNSFLAMLGYTREELLALQWKDITPERWHQFEQSLIETQVVPRGYSDVYEKEYVRKDGSVFPVEVRTYLLKDAHEQPSGMWAIVRDITERRLVEDARRRDAETIKRQLEEITSYYENAPIGLAVLDMDLRFQRINSMLAAIDGFPPEAHIGKTITELAPAIGAQAYRVVTEIMRTGKPIMDIEFSGTVAADPAEKRTWLESWHPLKSEDNRIVGFSIIVQDITERKSAERKLRESEERYRTTLDSMLEGCQIIGHDWTYLYLNRTAAIHNRRPNEDLLGKRYIDVWPGIEDTNVCHVIGRCLERRIAARLEDQIVFPDGVVRWYDLSIQPVPEGVFILSIDITERKKTETALRESEDKYRLVSENSEDWVFWTAPDGQLRYVSPACQRITGYSTAEIMKRPEFMTEIAHADDREALMSHLAHGCDGREKASLEFRIITKTGETRWISHSCAPMVDSAGGFVGRRGTNRDITERKLAEEALQNALQRLRRFVDSNIVGVVIATADGKIIEANDYYLKMIGYTRQEFAEGKVDWRAVTPSEWLPADEKAIAELSERGVCAPYEKEYVRRDGSRVTVLLADAMLPGSKQEIAAFIVDITERKSAERALRESERRLREAQEMAHLGYWTWYVKSGDVEWSDEVFRIFGLDPSRFTPKIDSILALSPWPEDNQRDKELIQRAIQSRQPGSYEQRFLRPDGSIGHYYSTFQGNFDDQGELVSIVGTVLDITDRKRAEEELRRLNAELDQRVSDRTQQLQEVNSELEAFAHSVSHDLRAPLRNMNGFSQALLEDYSERLDDRGREYLNRIREGSRRMSQLIDALLRLSKATRLEMSLGEVDLSLMASEIMRELQASQPERQLEFCVTAGMSVVADTALIRIALMNLLSNAWKFTGNREVARIEFGRVTATGESATLPDEEVFYVRDNGTGFDMTYAARLFGVFQRLHSESEFAGTGIGLATVQRVIRRHGGRVWAEGVVGEGATFYFAVPKHLVQDGRTDTARQRNQVGQPTP